MPEKHNLYVAPCILSVVSSIDLKVATTTNLYTALTGVVITDVVFVVTSSATFTVAPTLGVGVAAGEADIMPATALTGINTTNFYHFSCEGAYVIGHTAEIIKLGIDVGATAGTAVADVTLVGYLFADPLG